MRTLQYSTPHGITVTRTMSKANYRKGLRHLLRELDTCRGIYLSSGYEFPGRYSRWDFASTRPPLEIVAFDRRVEFRPLNVRGEMLNQMLARRARGASALGLVRAGERRRAGRGSEAAAEAFSGRGAQQTAFGVLDSARADSGVSQRAGHAAGPGRRVRLRSAVSVRADREEAAAQRAEGPAPVSLRRHLLHGSQEGADRALSVRFRFRGTFDAGAGAHG